MYVSIYLSIYRSNYLSIFLSFFLSIYVYIYIYMPRFFRQIFQLFSSPVDNSRSLSHSYATTMTKNKQVQYNYLHSKMVAQMSQMSPENPGCPVHWIIGMYFNNSSTKGLNKAPEATRYTRSADCSSFWEVDLSWRRRRREG